MHGGGNFQNTIKVKKPASSSFDSKMIAKLKSTQRTLSQNKDKKTKILTHHVSNNNK